MITLAEGPAPVPCPATSFHLCRWCLRCSIDQVATATLTRALPARQLAGRQVAFRQNAHPKTRKNLIYSVLSTL